MKIEMTQDSESEFTLTIPKGDSAWVTVGNASLYIKNNDEGIAVDVYAKNREDGESVAGLWVLHSELEEET